MASPNTKALREEAGKMATTIRTMADKINAENRDFTAEEKEAWDKVNADYNSTMRRIEVLERADSVTATMRAPAEDALVGTTALPPGSAGDGANAVTEEHRALALHAWVLSQMGEDLSDAHVRACQLTRMNPNRKQLTMRLPSDKHVAALQGVFQNSPAQHRQRELADFGGTDIKAALSGVSGPAGGYLFPQSFVNQLEINMLAYGGILQAAEIMRTTSGERMGWPTANDTGNKGRRLGENAAVATTPDPTFGQVYWDAYDYTSDAVLVPYRLMQDSVFDIGTILGGMLGERLGRKVCQDDTTGSGANQPKGIVTAATLGVTTAGATAITFDEVLDLIFSVDPSHRANGRFMFHDLVLSTLRKLKDGQGKYLWEPSTQSGIPDRLWGYPYTINMEMSSTVAATDKTMLFGDLRKYKVRQVADVRFYRLTERYRDNDQDGFVAFSRQDGNLLTAGTAPVKYLQQHA